MSSQVKVDWATLAEKLHKFYGGKIETVAKVPITRLADFNIWYTPGVAEPCKVIHKESEDLSFDYTWRWNTVAVISDGTRVLGLGDIGPAAGLPVMEGKCLLFKYLGGVDCFPIVIREKDPDKLIYIIKALEPSFGGVNLEDIASPKCFYLLDKLQEVLNVPVWHDDQQGTALVVLAGLINAFKIVGKDLRKAKIALVGCGAANYSVLRYLGIYGVDLGNVIVAERQDVGILHRNHPRLQEFKEKAPHWYDAALRTNRECVSGWIPEALKDADAVIAASRPGPGVIKKEWIKLMADNPIVFSLANPVPEILPHEAKEAGARIVATGRGDFPNQINNSLGFPAVFRGAFTVRARKMSDEMFLAAAYAIAKYAEETGIHEERIVPRMEETEMYVREAMAVAEKAMELGYARRKLSRSELEAEIRELIERPKKEMELFLKAGLIPLHRDYQELKV